MEYTLPDGSLINIGRERFEAAEVLFTPSICNLDHAGLPEIVFNAIKVIFPYPPKLKILIGRRCYCKGPVI